MAHPPAALAAASSLAAAGSSVSALADPAARVVFLEAQVQRMAQRILSLEAEVEAMRQRIRSLQQPVDAKGFTGLAFFGWSLLHSNCISDRLLNHIMKLVSGAIGVEPLHLNSLKSPDRLALKVREVRCTGHSMSWVSPARGSAWCSSGSLSTNSSHAHPAGPLRRGPLAVEHSSPSAPPVLCAPPYVA